MSIFIRCYTLTPKSGAFKRFLSTNYTAQNKAIEKHAAKTATTWKWVSLLVAVPACSLLAYKNLVIGEEHTHSKGEWIPYDHIRIRKVQFPWGSESLFHSKYNNGPNQQEEETDVPKEHFITAILRKYTEARVKHDWKVLMDHVEEHHQQMMEHIEKKKFPNMRRYPQYASVFGYPDFDLKDKNVHLPNSLND